MKAEIPWCLNTIVSKSSYRSCDKANCLFASMFPESCIAQDFSMAKTKLRDCNHFTVMFDESFNSVFNKNQMDVWIRYFDRDADKIITRFVAVIQYTSELSVKYSYNSPQKIG